LLFITARPARAVLPPRFGGSLTVRMEEKMKSLDPILATRPDEFNVIFCLYDPLVRARAKNNLDAALLETMPELSSDGLVYYFKLKKDVLFHDGTSLDSSDVLHTVQRLIKSRRSPYAWIFETMAGAMDYRSGKAKSLSGFKIIDAQRFEITLAPANRHRSVPVYLHETRRRHNSQLFRPVPSGQALSRHG